MNIFEEYKNHCIQVLHEDNFFENTGVTPEIFENRLKQMSLYKIGIGEDCMLDEEEMTECLNGCIQDYVDTVMLKFLELELIKTGVNADGELVVKVTQKGIDTINYNKRHNASKKRS